MGSLDRQLLPPPLYHSRGAYSSILRAATLLEEHHPWRLLARSAGDCKHRLPSTNALEGVQRSGGKLAVRNTVIPVAVGPIRANYKAQRGNSTSGARTPISLLAAHVHCSRLSYLAPFTYNYDLCFFSFLCTLLPSPRDECVACRAYPRSNMHHAAAALLLSCVVV
ncbi:unnamed protein product [Ectocarpus sp. 12 AP-2014]